MLLADLWPADDEVAALARRAVTATCSEGARDGFVGDARGKAIGAEPSDAFPWDDRSTYVRRPPYFDGMGRWPDAPVPIEGARVLALLGDFITTDHISPAGSIAADSPAARYLQEQGVAPEDFNTYGSRRGNHEVMMRGTFANVKLANALAEGRKGGWTRDFLSARRGHPLYDAAEHYAQERVPLVVVAGKMYGSGSSRDWAAKGPALLGVRGVLAESFERIHRSNLIGMGILPLQFRDGENAETLGLDGSECYTVDARRLLAGAARTAGGAGDAPSKERRHRGGRSKPSCAWTRPPRAATSCTAASCRTCCANCWACRPDRAGRSGRERNCKVEATTGPTSQGCRAR